MLIIFGMVSIAQAAPEWQATLWVKSGGGENRLVVGADDTATDGFDPIWDVYTMLGGQLRSYFPHSDWDPYFQNYCRDVRAKAHGATTEWSFVIESDLSGKSVTITWDLSLFPSDHQITLIDDTGSQSIDLLSNSSYSFTYTAHRNFRVAVYAPETPVQKNKTPVANAGPDQTVECTGSYGANVTLDGSASSDPDGDNLEYTWAGIFGTVSGVDPQVQIPVGTHTITLTVDDGKGGTSQDTVLVTVKNDNVLPSITAKLTGTSGTNKWYISSVSVELISKDSCSGSKEIHYVLNGAETTVSNSSASITVDKDGVNNLSYWAVDNAGNKGTAYNQTINIDRTSPVVNISANPECLWPPNKKMVDVKIDGSATDDISGIGSVTITVTDEYGVYNMAVPGFGSTIQLEAWREGTDSDGRIYTITVVVTDGAGNEATGTVNVTVPHDKGG